MGWGIAGLILSTTTAVSIATFYIGKTCYGCRVPEGSPLTPLFQVAVAAIRKRKFPRSSDPYLLYEVPTHTNRLG